MAKKNTSKPLRRAPTVPASPTADDVGPAMVPGKRRLRLIKPTPVPGLKEYEASWQRRLEWEREQHSLALRRKDFVIERLRKRLDDALDRLDRRDGAPTAKVVHLAYKAAIVEAEFRAKGAEALLEERFGWHAKMVRRRLREWDEPLAREMGISVEEFRKGRIRYLRAHSPQSSDT